MKARTHNPWRLARLGRRLESQTAWSQIAGKAAKRLYKRARRGGCPHGYLVYPYIGKNHHEPVHEAKQRPPQPRKPAQRPQQVPDMWPDMSILAVAAQAKRKRMVR